VLLRCLTGLVESPAAILAATREPDARQAVRGNTQRAIELGIFGAPTFVVRDELFWGNDRLEAAFEWSRRRE
jgi:2-hydroxychromene-2-carboxylate isomerase